MNSSLRVCVGVFIHREVRGVRFRFRIIQGGGGFIQLRGVGEVRFGFWFIQREGVIIQHRWVRGVGRGGYHHWGIFIHRGVRGIRIDRGYI